MDKEKNNGPWLSIRQFGHWDQKGGMPAYSMDLSKFREMRKQNKREVSRASLGNEEEFVSSNTAKNVKQIDNIDDNINPFHKPTSTRKEPVLRYFDCCPRA